MPDLFGPSVQFKLSIPRAIPGAAGWYSLDPRRFLSNKAISVNERCHGTAPTVILMAGQQAGQSQGKRGKGRKLSISASLCPSGNPHSSGCKSPFPCPARAWMNVRWPCLRGDLSLGSFVNLASLVYSRVFVWVCFILIYFLQTLHSTLFQRVICPKSKPLTWDQALGLHTSSSAVNFVVRDRLIWQLVFKCLINDMHKKTIVLLLFKIKLDYN